MGVLLAERVMEVVRGIWGLGLRVLASACATFGVASLGLRCLEQQKDGITWIPPHRQTRPPVLLRRVFVQSR